MTIEIKYPCGIMETSEQSDLLYGTCAMSQWKDALISAQTDPCINKSKKKKK